MRHNMPADKHVRFAVSHVYHSAPPTPSPAFSDLSLPDTDAPLTPPTFMTPLEPIPEAETEVKTSAMRIHGTIAYIPGGNPILSWDVACPPTMAVPVPGRGVPSPSHFRAALGEAATNPPLPGMTLVSDFLPYRVTIAPGVGNGATSSPWTPATVPLPIPGMPASPSTQTVCVYDILVGLYKCLRTPLTPAEFDALAPTLKASLSAAYHARVARVADPVKRDEERRKGLKRVDYLLAAGKTHFVGLGATKQNNRVWILNLA
jgi:hypothetical protein